MKECKYCHILFDPRGRGQRVDKVKFCTQSSKQREGIVKILNMDYSGHLNIRRFIWLRIDA